VLNENQPLIFSPTDFVALTNQVLETAFGFIHIQGEVSNFRISKNKWVYFDLKDDYSKVACFASVYAMPGPIENGMVVVASGRPTLHQQFGFNFTVQSVRPSGEGSIKKAFDLLKAKLDKEGLFDEERKRTLPYPPNKIALVASIESAAYADFVKVMSARWPFVQISIYESLVQGENAPAQLENAVKRANSESELADVVVVIRGGGSADDLSAFNDERVVRAIASSRIPSMVAIGHEIDESLSELVSDSRASTPSNAAELLVPDRTSELDSIKQVTKIIKNSFYQNIENIKTANSQLLLYFAQSINEKLTTEQNSLRMLRQQVQNLNPQSVLNRGYAVVRITGKHHAIKTASQLKVGDTLNIGLSKGSLGAKVTKVNKE
jgi:exodeoxyribonuclease VII large subunit